MYNRILIQIEATQLPRKSLHQKFNYSLLFKTMGDNPNLTLQLK